MNKGRNGLCVFLALALLAAMLCGCAEQGINTTGEELYSASTFAMDTLVNQQAYGDSATDAMTEVNRVLASWDERLSLYNENSDIARVNAAAGIGTEVRTETAMLLQQALALSAQSEGAFAITIAPVTLAWGVMSAEPRVPADDELARLLPLVNDAGVEMEHCFVKLPEAGMAIDLGGIAKGAACEAARQVYDGYGVSSALISIGGNVYARGLRADGNPWRVGFRDPAGDGGSYIASVALTDQVIAVSGGYERFFEVDGQRYIHIFNPATGRPAESDIVAVGAICEDGAEADFWSTTLFVWGRERALEHMRAGALALLLDDAGTLYVSEGLREGFQLTDESGRYKVEFV